MRSHTNDNITVLTSEDQASLAPTQKDDARALHSSSISFVADPASIAKAVSVARLVTPRNGLLFSVQGNRCIVASHDGHREARSSFLITGSTGDGDFVYPTEFADEFAHVTSPVRLEATSDGPTFLVGYTFGAGASVTHVSVDPRGIPSSRRSDGALGSELDANVLAEGLKVAKPFVATPDDLLAADQLKAVHVFRDGTLFASNGRTACYFRAEGLVGRQFEVSASQLNVLEKFVKSSSGTLRVQATSARITVANERGDAFGWSRDARGLTNYPAFRKDDDVIALVNTSEVRATLRHVQCALDRHERKVRIHFDRARGIWLRSAAVTTDPVPAEFSEFRPSEVLVGRVDVDNLAKLFSATVGNAVEFRVTVVPPGGNRREPAFFFRTVDSFLVAGGRAAPARDATASSTEGAHRFTVTRYAPGIDR